MQLISQIESLKNSPIREIVEKRLNEFEKLGEGDNKNWYSELCFCILTANSRAASAMRIQNQVGAMGFLMSPKENIAHVIRLNKHRFHNNKAKFICEARKYSNIKDILKDKTEIDAREWLVENVKGLGYKEASHFLRNVGNKNIAILDRHILNLMVENKLLDIKPASLNKKNYLEIEKKFNELADQLKMSMAELDLYMWYMKTGVVLK
ncbi:MAG: N-glycosylase/DNA lyase [Candidatus Pacearchaeota archaeon]|jgi:N-glycosylase/DNA lyase